MIEIRLYEPNDLESLLQLIDRSISTNRSIKTWCENPMLAVLAFDEKKLIGALPLEQRKIEIGRGEIIDVLWVSAAHVDDEYRSQGIGARLDQFARSSYANSFDAFFVYREDETSRAYKWYRKMGFYPVQNILAYKKSVNPDELSTVETLILTKTDDALVKGDQLLECFRRASENLGGFPARTPDYWGHIFDAHYYQEFYEFSILAVCNPDAFDVLDAFALLGETSMRDDVARYDVLEFVAANELLANKLVKEIESLASRKSLAEIRLQLGAMEKLRWWAEQQGFQYRNRRTNILASLLDVKKLLKKKIEKLPALRLMVETPEQGVLDTDGGGELLYISMSDETLAQLLLNRLDARLSIDEQRVVVLGGNQREIDMFCNLFQQTPWRYFQSDYI